MKPVCTVLPVPGQVPVTRQSGQMTIRGKLINNNSIDATEGTMVLYRWKSWFSGIHEAAVFTENVDQAPLTVTERNQWKAEARALRAIYYFYLVRTYGPVPLLEKDFA